MNQLFFDEVSRMAPAAVRAHKPVEGERGQTDAPRLILVTDGYASVKTRSHLYRLSMMCLLALKTQNAYQFTSVSPECQLMIMDLTRLPKDIAAPDAAALREAYPILHNFDAQSADEYFFYDLDASVITLFTLMTRYEAYPPKRRYPLSGHMLNILMTTVAMGMEPDAHVPRSRHVAAAQRYIRAHYANRITATEVAMAAEVHVGHLYKLFTAEMGQTLNEYISRVRLSHASELLSFTDIPIKKVALLCGFSTQQYFARVFQTHTGMTPYAYRHSYDLTCDYQGYRKHLAGKEEG